MKLKKEIYSPEDVNRLASTYPVKKITRLLINILCLTSVHRK